MKQFFHIKSMKFFFYIDRILVQAYRVKIEYKLVYIQSLKDCFLSQMERILITLRERQHVLWKWRYNSISTSRACGLPIRSKRRTCIIEPM